MTCALRFRGVAPVAIILGARPEIIKPAPDFHETVACADHLRREFLRRTWDDATTRFEAELEAVRGGHP